jgi:trehalose 6-phosphate synthase
MAEPQPHPAEPSPLVVLSNRGPLSFSKDEEGRLLVRRAAGGLVVTLGPGVARAGARWVASAISEADREAAGQGVVESEGFRLQSLVIDPRTYQAYYNVIANGTLWYALHGLWDRPRRPRFDRRWFEAWDAYRRVNHLFAQAAAEAAAPGATVLVQDYQLALVPAELANARPDVSVGAFMHTPWCSPQELATLPDSVVPALLEGVAGAAAVGFHSPRWATNFADCCRQLLGRQPATFVAPAAPDADDTLRVAGGDACRAAGAELDRRLGGRRLIVRVDRIELSKNVLRGFHAYDELLEKRPDLRGEVVFGAHVYPSRQGLADYLSYGQEVQALAAWINAKWGTPQWQPVLMDPSDDYPGSVAALRRADVVLVNPVRDGLNLVAKEAALVNDRQAVLVLSRNAGCWEELGDASLVVNPFDVTATARALEEALDMTAAERQEKAAAWRKAVDARTPLDWFQEMLSAVRSQ